jgi:hypothetical protein
MQITRTTSPLDLPQFLSVGEVCTVMGIGRSLAYDLEAVRKLISNKSIAYKSL